MNNETNLGWLARTEHHWPEDAVYVSRHENAVEWHYVELAFKGLGHFTKDQWLSRRAELQNKPSWAGAPVWANWLAQDEEIDVKGVGGGWFWYERCPTPRAAWDADGGLTVFSGAHGAVLGDWRDTLEKRPEEFQPLTSIEDNQEQDMAQQQEMKQDNGWFERGELPPVGARVNVDGSGLVYGDGEKDCEVITHVEDTAVVRMSYGLGCFQSHVLSPSHTEREAAIEIMQSDISERWGNCEELAKHLIDKGWVKGAK